MSTAGKVLIVLTLLLIPVWVVMISAVAQLNRGWAEELEKQRVKAVQLEKDQKDAQASVVALKDETSHEQVKMDQELAVIAARQSAVEKRRSEALETEMRTKYQLADHGEALKHAQTDLEVRTAERKEETEALAAARSEIEKLRGENDTLMARLAGLRQEFKKLLGSNRELVNQLRKSGQKKTTTHSASLAR